jgi:hypothetical protein
MILMGRARTKVFTVHMIYHGAEYYILSVLVNQVMQEPLVQMVSDCVYP